ncbi:MAG: helix-turn-helix domain-containing protein, partial [Saprospiraceae bacterium]|nr:helix-turn-helix domain-containing protein [Saprospiraceae bacterium]
QQSELETGDLDAIYKSLPAGKEIWSTTDDLSCQTGLHPVHIKVGLSALETAGALEHLGDEGFRKLYRRVNWNLPDIEKAIFNSKQHIQNRQKQLNDMVHYAESNNCRRIIILHYFGDSDSAEVAECCDNCQIQKTAPSTVGNVSAMNHTERAGLIILDCIRCLKTRVGREKLAQILHGSKAQDILKYHHHQNTYYGRLAAIQQKETHALIGQLVDLGYIKVIGGEYPILSLTPRGENAIKQKEIIVLKLPKPLNEANVRRTQAKLEAGGTVEYTAKLFADGLKPEQIARERALALTTVYYHLAQLISTGKITVGQVVSGEVRKKIEEAIQKVGSIQYLSPIKALLPNDIDFNLIRCVLTGRSLRVSNTYHTSKAAKSEIESLILECIHAFPGKLPRSGVAKLLVGSLSKRVTMYQTHPLYNRLRGHSRS